MSYDVISWHVGSLSRSVVALEAVGVEGVSGQVILRHPEGFLALNIANLGFNSIQINSSTQ